MNDPAPLDLPAALAAAGFSLRPVEAGDLTFLQQLFRADKWAELAPTQWPDAAKIAFLDQQFAFQQQHFTIGYAGAEYYLVQYGGQPIGRFYVDRAVREIRLVEITLLAEWRGRGLGTALLTRLQDEVRAGRADRVGLNVLATNPARRLYARLGFVETGPVEEFPGPYLALAWPAS
jgi:ribosomal protein S18 acetylase RimI-like enzyme